MRPMKYAFENVAGKRFTNSNLKYYPIFHLKKGKTFNFINCKKEKKRYQTDKLRKYTST